MGIYRLSDAELGFFTDLEGTVADLVAYSGKIEVPNTDPRFVSLMLFNRLASNHRGFLLLWRADELLEAAIVLRAAIETTICLAANFTMREDFYPLLLGDLAATLKAQIKLWRELGSDKLVRDSEANLRAILPRAPEKPRAFDWQSLADIGGQPELYRYHKALSMVALHVTAISIMRGVVGVEGGGVDLQRDWQALERPKHIRQMAIALVIGLKLHAEIVDAADFVAAGKTLDARLSELSKGWVEE